MELPVTLLEQRLHKVTKLQAVPRVDSLSLVKVDALECLLRLMQTLKDLTNELPQLMTSFWTPKSTYRTDRKSQT